MFRMKQWRARRVHRPLVKPAWSLFWMDWETCGTSSCTRMNTTWTASYTPLNEPSLTCTTKPKSTDWWDNRETCTSTVTISLKHSSLMLVSLTALPECSYNSLKIWDLKLSVFNAALEEVLKLILQSWVLYEWQYLNLRISRRHYQYPWWQYSRTEWREMVRRGLDALKRFHHRVEWLMVHPGH